MGTLPGQQYINSDEAVSSPMIDLAWYEVQWSSRTNADSEQQANMTNLAVKGIIGIKAMAEISQTLGNVSDAQYFSVRRNYQCRSYLQWANTDVGYRGELFKHLAIHSIIDGRSTCALKLR